MPPTLSQAIAPPPPPNPDTSAVINRAIASIPRPDAINDAIRYHAGQIGILRRLLRLADAKASAAEVSP